MAKAHRTMALLLGMGALNPLLGLDNGGHPLIVHEPPPRPQRIEKPHTLYNIGKRKKKLPHSRPRRKK